MASSAPPEEPNKIGSGKSSSPSALELCVAAISVFVLVVTIWSITSNTAFSQNLNPAIAAIFLIGNLLPFVMLIVLIGRRLARQRTAAAATPMGGKLHVRLVAIFSLIASIPIVLTVIAASLLFQSGIEFWVSNRARTAFNDALTIARASQTVILNRWALEGQAMARDLARELPNVQIQSLNFKDYFARQTVYRNLEEAILFRYSSKQGVQSFALFEPPEEKMFLSLATPKLLNDVRSTGQPHVGVNEKRVWVISKLPNSADLFLYVGTGVNADFLNRQHFAAEDVIKDYTDLQVRSGTLQLQFNLALFVIVLLIVGVTVWIALSVADRLVRPVTELVDAARRVEGGDLTARVTIPKTDDEVGTLANAFNAMTARLQAQTGALVAANVQLDSRRALIEAVMSGVTAGVVLIDDSRHIRLINSSAIGLLSAGDDDLVDQPLAAVSTELDALVQGGVREAVVQLTLRGEVRTLAVKIARADAGPILTFDDITQQLLDQRTAAWSDVARRIAHEIKNPLTPIQLAAERLKRRYGKQIGPDDGTFVRLTDTIVRQVGDLRRMVDEFSSFARMPKPVFRRESLVDIGRQALFLHEVAHTNIQFDFSHPDLPIAVVCDRRQIGQALTNLVKNAVEAIIARGDEAQGIVSMALSHSLAGQVVIKVADTGVGLPIERDRIVEPYMTTRARGTGLGLAIVKKIVEEHLGTMSFADREGGGTVVTISFDPSSLDALEGDEAAPKLVSEDDRLTELTRNRAS